VLLVVTGWVLSHFFEVVALFAETFIHGVEKLLDAFFDGGGEALPAFLDDLLDHGADSLNAGKDTLL
jgi:hypothetical protein